MTVINVNLSFLTLFASLSKSGFSLNNLHNFFVLSFKFWATSTIEAEIQINIIKYYSLFYKMVITLSFY